MLCEMCQCWWSAKHKKKLTLKKYKRNLSANINWLGRNTKEIWVQIQIDYEEIEKKSGSKYKLTLWSLPAAWPVRYRPQPSISGLKCKHKLALSFHHYSSSIILVSHHDNHLKEGGEDHHHHPKMCLRGNIYKIKLNSMMRGHESPHIFIFLLGVLFFTVPPKKRLSIKKS